jgi:PAS domain S-box-containing protein
MSPQRRDVLSVALVVTLLVLVATPLEPRGSAVIYTIANRGLSLFAIWTTAIALYFLRRSQQDLAALNRVLEQRVRQRAEEAQRRAGDLAVANKRLEGEIAQRQQAESEVRNSQAMYISLVEDLPIPVIRKDANGKFIFANRTFCSWVGLTPDVIVGKSDFDLFPPAMAAKYHDDDTSVLTTGELFLDVERNEHSGTVKWVHVIKTPARDGANKIIGTQAIFWDVTARRVAEDRLRDSEALYHSLVETLPLCLVRKDENGVFTFVNQAFCQYFSTSPAHFIGQTDFDKFSLDVAQKYRAGDKHVMTTGQTIQSIESIQLPDGRQRKIQVFKSAVRDARAAAVGVQIIFRDVTDELAIADALRESQQRLQAMLDNTSAVVYLKDVAGRYQLINREFEKLFHVQQQEIVGRTDHEVFPLEFAEAFRANDVRVAQSGETLVTEEVAPHSDGPHTYVSSKFPLRNAQGEVFAVAGISTDITERRRAEEQLQLYAARLEATNRELEEFAYIVSHDLQEPLRTLSFFSDSLQHELGDILPEQSRQDLRFITTAAERMQQLVRDLLALSRAGRADLKRERVNLAECVQAALTALSTRLKETSAAIEVGELPEVFGDRTLLTQLFQNLIGNAVKFAGPQTPQVSISAQRREGSWVVGVRDNGIGIKPEYAQKIFAPFQRLHAQAEYEGTGIGLAICRKVVQRHGGKIWVDSVPGEGAHFQFELPIVNGET